MFKENILELIKRYTYGDTFSEQWSNGGTYGTCWDEDGPSECGPDPEPDRPCISGLLREFDSEMTEKSVEIIESKIEYDSYRESDYYGGCQEYCTKTLTLDALCGGLTQAGYGIL